MFNLIATVPCCTCDAWTRQRRLLLAALWPLLVGGPYLQDSFFRVTLAWRSAEKHTIQHEVQGP